MNRAIVTLTIGDAYNELAKFTHPTQRRYAEKIGADFIVIRESKFPTDVICYEKLQIGDLLKAYDRVAYFDTDIVIRRHTPDIFGLVPHGWFGAFCEGLWTDRTAPLKVGAEQFKYDKETLLLWKRRYFNAGVMVVDRSHRVLFTPPPVFHNNFEDQTWMNIQVSQKIRKFLDIGPHFNRMACVNWEDRFESFVIHYAGGHTSCVESDLKAMGEI